MTSTGKFSLVLIASCIVGCREQPDYPVGGFKYPQNVAAGDTVLYHYQLKDIQPKLAAFRDSYLYLFYRPFNEPNLSIKPQPKETFRLTYSTAFGEAVIITFNKDDLLVKKGAPGILYTKDTTRLTEI